MIFFVLGPLKAKIGPPSQSYGQMKKSRFTGGPVNLKNYNFILSITLARMNIFVAKGIIHEIFQIFLCQHQKMSLAKLKMFPL